MKDDRLTGAPSCLFVLQKLIIGPFQGVNLAEPCAISNTWLGPTPPVPLSGVALAQGAHARPCGSDKGQKGQNDGDHFPPLFTFLDVSRWL